MLEFNLFIINEISNLPCLNSPDVAHRVAEPKDFVFVGSNPTRSESIKWISFQNSLKTNFEISILHSHTQQWTYNENIIEKRDKRRGDFTMQCHHRKQAQLGFRPLTPIVCKSMAFSFYTLGFGRYVGSPNYLAKAGFWPLRLGFDR